MHLQLLFPTFATYHLSGSATPPIPEEDAIDLPQLICPLLDFVTAIARDGKAKEWFTNQSTGRMGELITEVVQWSQMTEDDVGFITFPDSALTADMNISGGDVGIQCRCLRGAGGG